MSRILKASGNFANLGDTVLLQVPAWSHVVALRLYEETQEIAIFYVTDAPKQFAKVGAGIVPKDVVRSFTAIEPNAELPDTFVKYIGAMGLKQPQVENGVVSPLIVVPGPVEVHIIEVKTNEA